MCGIKAPVPKGLVNNSGEELINVITNIRLKILK